jgi:hypothetical protein
LNDTTQKILTVEDIVELAMTVEEADPIDWSAVNISPDTAYRMMAAHVIDLLEEHPAADREMVMMGVMTKLMVENFFLNLQIQQNNS